MRGKNKIGVFPKQYDTMETSCRFQFCNIFVQFFILSKDFVNQYLSLVEQWCLVVPVIKYYLSNSGKVEVRVVYFFTKPILYQQITTLKNDRWNGIPPNHRVPLLKKFNYQQPFSSRKRFWVLQKSETYVQISLNQTNKGINKLLLQKLEGPNLKKSE